jgi:hypothetical protein
MKSSLSAVIGVTLGLLTAVNVHAQNVARFTTPAPVQQTAYDSEYYVAASQDRTSPATSDKASSPAVETSGDAKNSDPAGEEKPSCRWCRCGKLAEPWTIRQPDFLKDRNVTIGGWLEGGIYGNQWGAPYNGPVGLRGIGDGFNANQAWFFAERKTDTKGCGWDIGGRIDYLFGTDGPQTQSFGDRTFDYGWNTSNQYGSAMPQLYAEIAYNDVKVKAGHFYTPIGYEVVQAPQNFFYSHSYSHTFGEPFTHTGALASYQRSEKTTWYGGWVNGWDEGFEGKDNGSMFLGGFSTNLSEKATFAWYVSAGKLGDGDAFTGAASGDLYYNCFIFTYKLTDKWTYIFEHDLGSNSGVNPRNGVDNQWYEVNNYLTYKINDCWSFGGRAEWFQDPQGARVSAGSRGNYFSLTGGFNYRPHSNITIRPELRYDWFDGFAGTTAQPFNDGTASTQLSGGFDVIFTF